MIKLALSSLVLVISTVYLLDPVFQKAQDYHFNILVGLLLLVIILLVGITALLIDLKDKH